MTEAATPTIRPYPRKVEIGEGRVVTLRLMEKSDRDRMVDFARSLPPNDLLFLRKDITDPKVVDGWIRDIEAARAVTVVAEKGDDLLAYGSLWLDETFWGRHMGEIRVQVAAGWRGLGLGLQLASEIFGIAKSLGVEKIVARLTKEQERTRAILERLGFKPEALLKDFVLDRDGKPRDLLVMSAGVGHLTDVEQMGMWRRS